MKILIAVPCMDMMHTKFVQSLIRLRKPGEAEIKFCADSLVYEARNELVRNAINENFDYVLFIDSDMTFEPDTLIKLLEDDVDIVTALYFQRKNEHYPCIYNHLEPRKTTPMLDFDKKSRLFRVEAFGTGLCLIKTKVFIDCVNKTGGCFECLDGLSEDLSFCQRAKQSGYRLHCDKSIKCGHVGLYEYTEKDFKQ